jgi:hypothetical protein
MGLINSGRQQNKTSHKNENLLLKGKRDESPPRNLFIT